MKLIIYFLKCSRFLNQQDFKKQATNKKKNVIKMYCSLGAIAKETSTLVANSVANENASKPPR